MKYLEEIGIGDCFTFNSKYFILTGDFKKNGSRYSVDLKTGQGFWLSPDSEVENLDIFTLDKENNIIAIKERKKDTTNDHSTTT